MARKTVYIVVGDRPDLGVYLGNGSTLETAGIAIFGNQNRMHAALAAPSYPDKESAQRTIDGFERIIERNEDTGENSEVKVDFKIVPVEVDYLIRGIFVSAADLIKAGYGNQIGAMVLNVPSISRMEH